MKIPRHYFRKRSLTKSKILENFMPHWTWIMKWHEFMHNPIDPEVDYWGFSEPEFYDEVLKNNPIGHLPNLNRNCSGHRKAIRANNLYRLCEL